MCEFCDNKDKRFEDEKFGVYDSRILTEDNIIRLYNQGGWDFVEFKCNFCPICGNKLEERCR